MTEIGLLEIRFRTDFFQNRVGVIHTAVDTVGILGTAQEILLNAFGTGVFGAVFTNDFSAENSRIDIGTDTTEFLFFLLRLLLLFFCDGCGCF